MKYLKLTFHELGALVVLIGSLVLRIVLAHGYWPLPNSDEATMGLMAMHVQHGELPIFFSGQHYMGVLEAYLAAPFFDWLGASVFALRLALILLFSLFLVTMYLLTRSLYTRNFALFMLALYSLGSNAVLSRELSAIGGYMETILFAALSFLLASWLALSAATPGHNARLWRLVGYAAWGLVIGLAVWSDLLILPFLLCTGLLLLLFCRRELIRGTVIPLVLCFLLGAAPLLIYNIFQATPGQDSWSVLMSLQGRAPLAELPVQIYDTAELSIPTITGSPFCHYSENQDLALLGYEASPPLSSACYVVNAGWSLAYLGLFGCSMGLAGVALRKKLSLWRSPAWSLDERSLLVKQTTQFLLGVSGLLTLLIFVHSSMSSHSPAIHSRYLIGLWLVAPLAVWPLWQGAQGFRHALRSRVTLRGALSVGALIALLAIFAGGTIRTLYELPAALQASQQEQALIDGLHKAGIVHVYSGYWTCDRLMFEAREQVICAVVDTNVTLKVNNHYARDPRYVTMVIHDPQSSYMFTSDLTAVLQAVQAKFQRAKVPYRRFTLEGYTVIQPLSA